MSDILIIKTISKIHFILVTILLFIGITFSSLFFLLQDGITIKNIHFPNLKVEQLYIKWNKKLLVDVENLIITPSTTKSSQPFEKKKIAQTLDSIFFLNYLFEKVTFRNIEYGTNRISFAYDPSSSSFIHLSSDLMACSADFTLSSTLLNVHAMACKLPKQQIRLEAAYSLMKEKQSFNGNIALFLPNDTNASVHMNGNGESLSYDVAVGSPIKNIKEIISLFSPSDTLRYWVHDAIEVEDVSLLSCKGFIEYDKISDAYKNLHAIAKANKLHYAYNSHIDAVHSEYTDLEFKSGILYITPRNATSYDFNLQNSRLFIDFSKPEESLHLFLAFDALLNDDILYLLKQYKITLPLKQNSGITTTDLKIDINLRTLKTTAEGSFTLQNANIDYLGLNLDAKAGKVFLDANNNLTISDVDASYKNIAHAKVNAAYSITKREGDVSIALDKFLLKEYNFSLAKTELPLQIIYKLSNGHDTLVIPSSKWYFYKEKITLAAQEIPFDFTSLEASLPITNCTIENVGSAFLSGELNLRNKFLKLNIDLLDFRYKKFALSQSHTPLVLSYVDDRFSVRSKDKLHFSIDNHELSLSQLTIQQSGNFLKSSPAKLSLANAADMEIQASYDIKKQSALIDVARLRINETNPSDTNQTYTISIQKSAEKLTLQEPKTELTSLYDFSSNAWHVTSKNLAEVSKILPLFKKYHLTNGTLHIAQKATHEPIAISVQSNYPYHILLEANEHSKQQILNALYDPKTKNIEGTINENISFYIREAIEIEAKNIGIDIHELVALIESFQANKKAKTKDIYVKAVDSYIYLSDNRRIVSEKIDVQYFEGSVMAQLYHKEGEAGFRYENKNFDLYGEKFNAEFMENLFYLSKFKGGTFSFSMNGTFKDYNGIFYIKETTIVEYKILNNILAFVNTIPSLVTFSLPGYSTKGLFANQAYMKFNAKDGALDISDIYLESQEMTILGKGSADYLKDTINLELNLKTDLGSSASKIPIVGYILFDEDSIATTLSVTGKLSNPTIESLIAKEIMVAPFNIIKRSLLLPYHLLNK